MSIKYDSLLGNELSDNIDDIKNILIDEVETCLFEDMAYIVKIIKKFFHCHI